MNTTFTARHFTASDRLKSYADQNVKKLQRYYDSILICDVVLEPHENPDEPQKAELNLKVAGDVLTASETGTTYEHAINRVVDNMKRQLIKYKKKRSVT